MNLNTKPVLTRNQIISENDRNGITWELYVTTACNLKCRYCYNENTINEHYREPSYSITDLVAFLGKYARQGDCLSFIGGEPFIRSGWITQVISVTKHFGFEYEAYTNGVCLDQLPLSFINRFKNLLISIDGDKRQNDFSRGNGTYSKIVKNLDIIKPDFKGELIARMTVTADNNLEKSVKSILNLPYFNVIYWQMQNTCELKNFPVEKKWTELNNLIDLWMTHIKQGKVLPFQTFIAIVVRLLDQENTEAYQRSNHYLPSCTLGCGAGHHYFQIFTTGDIYACPEIVCRKDNLIGNISEGMYRRIELNDFPNTSKCRSCIEFDICHCRCLHCTPDEYCTLLRRTIARLRKELPLIKGLMRSNGLSRNDFHIKERLEEMF